MNRGVDGRAIFLDSSDYVRFVHDLYEFNDRAPAKPYVGRGTSKRELLVDIHGWCLMKNHYHLLISERSQGGMTLFLRKLTGYPRYFNEKYERSGLLMQRVKKVRITTERHFLYILHYIHLNPLDYLSGAEMWRERDKMGIPDIKTALNHLDSYRWSSFLDYSRERNFPSLITTDLFTEVFPDYRAAIAQHLLSEADRYKEIQLE
jgi:putative transposase